jgi:heterodisulfide reductase subunit B
MNYLYYPGCSLSTSGRAYDESTRYVFGSLGIPMPELEDWNCCGATAYMSVSELQAVALSARNLAIAEKQSGGGGKGKRGPDAPVQVMAPCAACYLGLVKAQHFMDESQEVLRKVRGALDSAGLSYEGRVEVRHPLDVLANDVGFDRIKQAVTRPLEGLRVACYYGCQIVRPYASFDDQYDPTSMDALMKTVGAETVNWPLKTRCCGASLTGTHEEVGLRLSYILLKDAKRRKADVIATACPLCQFNLECLQPKMRHAYGEDVTLPVAYFTQLLGVALGGSKKELGLGRLFVPLEPALTRGKKSAVGSH